MIPFDIKSLFTNVPLQKTIDIILKCIYENKEINTSICKKDMKDLCQFYVQKVFIFLWMVKFIYKLIEWHGTSIKISFCWDFYGGTWKIFSSKTQQLHQILEAFCWWHITFATIEAIDHILMVLNSFNRNIQFTYETEGIWNCYF